MSSLWSDLRYAVRSWLKAPASALLAIVTIAAGVATMTAVFALVNTVLLKPLPYPDADRLVVLVNSFRGQPSRSPYTSAPRVRAWRERAAIDTVALYRLDSAVSVVAAGEPRQVASAHVNASFFSLFGARVVRGRFFTTVEDQPGQASAAVISRAWWQQLGGRDDIIGQPIVVNGKPAAIVGVLEDGFDARSLSPDIVTPPDLWLPLQLDPLSIDDANNLMAVTRLDNGESIDVARQRARAAAEEFRAAFPKELATEGSFDVMSLSEVVVGDVRASLLTLFAAVGLLAVLVSANVANLLLARTAGRRREFAVRAALGASRRRLVRQLVLEGCSLSAVGGIAGSVLGVAGIRLVFQLETVHLPRVAQLGLTNIVDIRMLLLLCLTVLAIGVAIGLAPAFTAARSKEGANLELRGGSRVGPDRRHRHAQALLLAGEAAITCVLLIGAVLLMRSFVNLNRVDPGFDGAGVVTLQTTSSDRRLASSQGAIPVFGDGLERLANLPGVEAAAVSLTGVPLAQGGALRADIPGRQADRQYVANWDVVSTNYFDVFKIRLSHGRLFDDRDRRETAPVVVINETMARELWPTENPVGQRIVIGQGGGPAFEEHVPREIVGVVADVRQFSLSRPPRPGMYVPIAQMSDSLMAFINRLSVPATWSVRTSPTTMISTATLQRELLLATALPAVRVRTMDQVVGEATASTAQHTWLMTALGSLALLVAVLGVYAIAAHSAQQRSHELGVRLALGAPAASVRRIVVWESIRVVLVGAAVGVTAAAGLSALLATMLFGVTEHDPLTFVTVPAFLVAAAFAGAYLPARRASIVDPLLVLRE